MQKNHILNQNAAHDTEVRLIPPREVNTPDDGDPTRQYQSMFEGARADLERLTVINPSDARACDPGIFALSCEEECRAALASNRKVIMRNEINTNAFYRRGVAWRRKGDNERAIADLNRAIEANPGFAVAFRQRGLAWAAKGNFLRALEDAASAVKLHPDLNSAHQDIERYKRKFTPARSIATKTRSKKNGATKISSEEAARQACIRGSFPTPSRRFNACPNDAIAFHYRGLNAHKKGRYEKAISEYSRALYLNRMDSVVYRRRGLAWEAIGDLNNAVRDAIRAIELYPGYREARNDIDRYRKQLGISEDVLKLGLVSVDASIGLGCGKQDRVR